MWRSIVSSTPSNVLKPGSKQGQRRGLIVLEGAAARTSISRHSTNICKGARHQPQQRSLRTSSAVQALLLRCGGTEGSRSRRLGDDSFARGRLGWNPRKYFASEPTITTVVMPALSPTMTHGTISEWVKKPGEACGPGDVLCEIETDKATVAFEVQDDYVLAKILEEAKGREIKVGEPVALSVEDEAAYKAFAELDKAGKITLPGASGDSSSVTAPTFAPSASPEALAQAAEMLFPTGKAVDHGEFSHSPAARHMLQSRGLELRGVQGTGKSGRITKADVILAISNGQVVSSSSSSKAPVASTSATEKTTTAPTSTAAPAKAASAAPSPSPSPSSSSPVPQRISPSSAPGSVTIPEINAAPGSFEDTKNSNMRKVIARRLAESKAKVPHSYETVDCELDAVLSFRKRLKKEYEVSVSVNDVIIRSAALALRDVPEANAFWDGEKGSAVINNKVDISVAVATPTGLITPIMTASDQRRLTEISSAMRDLAGRARQGKLKPEEFQGGSFTISNLGMFGIDEFSAVINPPQAAIMAIGRGAKRMRAPAFTLEQDTKSLKPYVATVMTAMLSYDRRVIDDALAGQFLQTFKAYMSNPELLLL